VHGREKRVLLREYLDQGWNKAALAQKLGISRRTIYHWIATGQLDRDLDQDSVRYQQRPMVPRKIDEYRWIIHTRLDEYPALSAVRIHEEIRSAGYDGGYTQVREYVKAVRPRAAPEPMVRFETPPGHQAQVDFAHFRLPWGRRWALVFVLSYSRLLWVRFFPRQDMRALTSGLEQAFGAIGGVPKEILFDQMRAVAVADRRQDGGPLVENAEFVRFANHWGFRARLCRPYRAKTKGKVERPIRYLRESFFYGRRFVSDADLDAELMRWLDATANVRTHRTTGQKPIERFQRDEKALLSPLAATPYRSLVLPPEREAARTPIPTIEVQRRPLKVYGQLVGERA